MITLKIETGLFHRDELFYVMALGQAVGMPVLLIGEPGVGKTQAAREYAAALDRVLKTGEGEHVSDDGAADSSNKSDKKWSNSAFILQATHESRATEITGAVDITTLLEKQRVEYFAPISKARVVVIDEVDKGTPSFRNSILSAMNERVLLRGDRMVPCNWDVFIGACNTIPDDDESAAFWDRFGIKYKVSGLSQNEHIELFKLGSDQYKTTIEINIPTKEEIRAVNIPVDYFKKFAKLASDAHKSDRVIQRSINLIRAATVIWQCPVELAVVRVTSLVVGIEASEKLSKELFSEEMKIIMNAAAKLPFFDDDAQLQAEVERIDNLAKNYVKDGKLSKAQLKILIPYMKAALVKAGIVGDSQSDGEGATSN